MSVRVKRVALIVLYGTSLTTGRLSGQWDRKLEAALNARCNRRVKVYSHGKGSQTSDWAVANMEDQVLRFNPDIIYTEGFSINDAAPSLFPGGVAAHGANLDILIPAFVDSGAMTFVQTMSPGPGRPDLDTMYDMDLAKAAQYGATGVDTRLLWPEELTAAMTSGGDLLHPLEAETDPRTLFQAINTLTPVVNAMTK